MVSGQFWGIKTGYDEKGALICNYCRTCGQSKSNYAQMTMNCRDVAQSLLGRSIFIRYLVDRGIVGPDILKEFGSEQLFSVLVHGSMLISSFDLENRTTFNGDLFPIMPAERKNVRSKHLHLVAQTLAGVSPTRAEGSLWPYKFDVIPIELISSIYEQFAHSENTDEAASEGLH